MKILIIHNRYLERGGEDGVVDSEINLLKQFGHSVIFYESTNKEIDLLPLFKKIHYLTKDIIWSDKSYKDIKSLVKMNKPDIAQIHNLFYNISPSVYYALKEEGVPIVQTLHNYRLICPNGLLYIGGKVCEKCIHGNFHFSFLNKCWRRSYVLSFFLARMLGIHLKKNTFIDNVDFFIALSEFSKNKYIEAGFPKNNLLIKPNFVEQLSPGRKSFQDYGIFIGRLEDYKGIHTLLAASQKLKNQHFCIIGDGPLYNQIKERARMLPNIKLLGRMPYDVTIEYLKNASFLVYPSICYEACGRSIIEAFACGVPVVASNRGAMKELVKDNVTGILFEPRNSDDLANKIEHLMQNKDLIIKFGENAYKEYQDKYTPKKNYNMLMEIYKKSLDKAASTNN
jgi:glycosyltransferase involved in cell wall biosynthesis